MKRNFLKKLIASIAAASLVITAFTPIALTDTAVVAEAAQTIPLKVTFDRSGAQSILGMINSFRTGGDAWYWDSDDSTKINCGSMSALQWDSGLEQAAMQRAAEIALSYSHTRPDGSDCFSAYQWSRSVGENIAAGYRSASAVNSGWREDDEQYSGQGHRRNMLSSDFSYIGIAHVRANGTDYWVEEFSGEPAGTSYSYGDGSQTANVDADNVTFDISTNYDISEMKAGETVTLPEATCLAKGQSYWGDDGVTVDTPVTASIGNTDVAELNGNSLVAKKAGAFDVTFSCSYCTKTIHVTVKEDETATDKDKEKKKEVTDKSMTNENADTGNNTDDGRNTDTNQPSDDDSDTYTVVVKKPAKVSGVKIKRSGKKAKISWKRKAGIEYRLMIKVGKKTYGRTTYKGSYTVKAKKGQKVTVKITAVRYDDDGNALKSKQVTKTIRL